MKEFFVDDSSMVRDTRKIHDSEPRGLSKFFGSTDQEAFSMVISFANEHVEIKERKTKINTNY